MLSAPVIRARNPTRGVFGETRPCAIVLMVERQPDFPGELLVGRCSAQATAERLA
jgi:hypothetical protein